LDDPIFVILIHETKIIILSTLKVSQ